jgi:hypothetical protein
MYVRPRNQIPGRTKRQLKPVATTKPVTWLELIAVGQIVIMLMFVGKRVRLHSSFHLPSLKLKNRFPSGRRL